MSFPKLKVVVTALNGDGSLKLDCKTEYDRFGNYEIGRGVLNIQEKKCSRKQITIKINENNKNFVTSNGVNPSYLKKNNSDTFIQMNKDQDYPLDDSDCLSLLFESHTFIVNLKPNPLYKEVTSIIEKSNNTTKRKLEDTDIFDHEENQSEEKKKKSETTTTNNNNKPECPHGKDCYRKNKLHFEEFSHSNIKDQNTSTTTSSSSNKQDTIQKPTTTTTNNSKNIDQIPQQQQKPIHKDTTSVVNAKNTSTATTTTTTTNNNNNTSVVAPTTTATTATSSSLTSNTTGPNKFIGAKFKKRKLNDVGKKRTLVFPFISTLTFNFDVGKAVEVAGKVIQSYLNFHSPIVNGEDDIKLKMMVDTSIYSENLINQFKSVFDNKWDSRFEIIKVNSIQAPNEVFCSHDCRIYATETTWRLKKTPQNKLLYDDLLGSNFENETKKRFPNLGKVGKVYPVPLSDDSTYRKEYGVDTVILILGPNMNPNKPDSLKDYTEAIPLLTETYHSLFNALDNY